MLDRSMKVNLRPFAVALALLAGGCTSTPAPMPVDAGGMTDMGAADVGVDVPVDVPPRCTSNAMCTTLPGRPLCDLSSGACVSCAQLASACTAGQYCNTATGACIAGCSTDQGCASPGADGGTDGGTASAARCDTLTHACVQCVTDDHCPSGMLCRGSTCVMGCTATRACPTGQSCCDGACLDSATNIAACGACGTVCRTPNGVPACSGGVCALGACTAPYDNCDGDVTNGCESNLQADPTHCGACGTACEVRANATAACVMGTCGSRCNEGFADCDGDAGNGCEVDLRTSAANCGRCGGLCPSTGGTAVCTAGVCGIGVCGMGFENCDSDAANGCETDVRGSVANCGTCGTVAPTRANATATCVAGVPGIACNAGFGNCDGDATNGCETDLTTSAANCGACATACPSGPGAAATCLGARCSLACAVGRADCDGVATNGCEVTLATDIQHCNSCDGACAAGPSSTALCTAGACSIRCATGFANCDGNRANGCEIDTRVSQANCGACGTVCAAGQVCNNSVCVAPCVGAQTRCSGTCVSLVTDNANCGACGAACATGSTCTDGVCRCALGGSPTGGVSCGTACVDVLTDAANCGACGNGCGTGNTCVRGVCRCSLGGSPIGIACGGACVDPIVDTANCGRCGNACGTGETCLIGVCRCVDSMGSPGTTCGGVCSDPATDRNNCGACGTRCRADQVCGGSMCRCATGFGTCGGVCTDLGTATNCGACGTACPSGQSCVGGACFDLTRGTFRIESLLGTGSRLIEHEPATGDDRGGIAVSSLRAFYTGDSATGRFALADVSGGASVGRQYDAITGDLRTALAYTLATDATTPMGQSGGAMTHLIQLDSDTGALTTFTVALSTPITVSGGGTAIFAGFGRIVLLTNGHAYSVLLPTGTVVDHGVMAVPGHQGCESWAFWGTAEFFGGNLYVDYVQNSTTIARTLVPSGTTTTLATFTSLSDMCSFTISVGTNRWYWHHEGGSQFGGSDESIGYADATFSTP